MLGSSSCSLRRNAAAPSLRLKPAVSVDMQGSHHSRDGARLLILRVSCHYRRASALYAPLSRVCTSIKTFRDDRRHEIVMKIFLFSPLVHHHIFRAARRTGKRYSNPNVIKILIWSRSQVSLRQLSFVLQTGRQTEEFPPRNLDLILQVTGSETSLRR